MSLEVECCVQFESTSDLPKPWMTCHIDPVDFLSVLNSGMLGVFPLVAIRLVSYIPDEDDDWEETHFIYDFKLKEWRLI